MAHQGYHLGHYPTEENADYERAPLTGGGSRDGNAGPFQGPFDETASGASTPEGFRSQQSLPYNPMHRDGQTSSPTPTFMPSQSSRPASVISMDDWRRRQGPQALRRYATRKVKLQHGQVLSIDYPVPSAVSHAIQSKFKSSETDPASNEFTHMRCKFFPLSSFLL